MGQGGRVWPSWEQFSKYSTIFEFQLVFCEGKGSLEPIIIMTTIGTINVIILMLLCRPRGAWSRSGGYR